MGTLAGGGARIPENARTRPGASTGSGFPSSPSPLGRPLELALESVAVALRRHLRPVQLDLPERALSTDRIREVDDHFLTDVRVVFDARARLHVPAAERGSAGREGERSGRAGRAARSEAGAAQLGATLELEVRVVVRVEARPVGVRLGDDLLDVHVLHRGS